MKAVAREWVERAEADYAGPPARMLPSASQRAIEIQSCPAVPVSPLREITSKGIKLHESADARVG